MRFPSCALQFLSRPDLLTPLCSPPSTDLGSSKPALSVSHAYMVHYTRNYRRMLFQLFQMPQLGLNVSVVTGFDADELDGAARACLLGSPPSAGLRDIREPSSAPYASQTIKLYVALYDMAVRRNLSSALILEDDAQVRTQYLPLLEAALQKLAGNYTILHAGSYSRSGGDAYPIGLHIKPRPQWRVGGMMAAVGTVISARGAAWLLGCWPIVAAIDVTLSDNRVCGGRAPNQWYRKRYAFVPNATFDEWIHSNTSVVGSTRGLLSWKCQLANVATHAHTNTPHASEEVASPPSPLLAWNKRPSMLLSCK